MINYGHKNMKLHNKKKNKTKSCLLRKKEQKINYTTVTNLFYAKQLVVHNICPRNICKTN